MEELPFGSPGPGDEQQSDSFFNDCLLHCSVTASKFFKLHTLYGPMRELEVTAILDA